MKSITQRNGVAMVELAIVLPILMLLLFCILELSLMIVAASEISAMAREGCRSLSAGEVPDVVNERIAAACNTLEVDDLTIQMQYRAEGTSGGWSGDWDTVGSGGSVNDAPMNSQVRCIVHYNYKIQMPGLFPFLMDDKVAGTKHLAGNVVMMRS